MSTQVHPSAVVDRTAQLGQDVVIGPFCLVDPGAVIGDGTILDAGAVVGRNVRIGKNNKLYPHCVIGRPPQMLGWKPDSPMGGLSIGDGNTIREFVTIHPSIHKEAETRIGNDNLIMVGVHIGHDCTIEDKIVISNQTQISGHCKVETGCWLSGMVAVHQFVTFGKWCYAAGMSGVNQDIPPFVIISGHYPPEVRSINKRGLNRAGLTPEQQKNIMAAFRRLYRGTGAFLDRVRAMAAEDGHDENVRAMIDAILRSSQHRFGRYLESLREKH